MTQPTETNSSNLPATCDPSVMDQLVSGALGLLSRLQDTIDLTLDEVSDWIM